MLTNPTWSAVEPTTFGICLLAKSKRPLGCSAIYVKKCAFVNALNLTVLSYPALHVTTAVVMSSRLEH